MSRLSPIKGLLYNLEGRISQQTRSYLPKDEALKQLKAKTGQDFGHDTAAWRTWLREQGKL